MSPKIQNELIQLLPIKIKNITLKQFEFADFSRVIMDTAQEINREDQVSQIIRYISISENEAGRPTNFKIDENFSGFIEVTHHLRRGYFKQCSRECVLFTLYNVSTCHSYKVLIFNKKGWAERVTPLCGRPI